MKYCTKCILNEHTPFISFDKNGKCIFCHEQKIIQSNKQYCLYQKESDLKNLLAKYKSNTKYDCIILVSGGKDSIGALYVAKKIYNLSPLAVTLDNQFLVDGMIRNIEKAVGILNIDWRLYRYSNIKKGFEHFLKSDYRKKISLCDACQLFVSPLKLARKIAHEENIKIILTGSTMAQKIGCLKKDKAIPAHQKYSKRYRKIMNDLKKYFSQYNELADILWEERNLDSIIITSPWYYIDQSKLKLDQILKSLKWKQVKQSFPQKSTNCKLSFLTGYLGRKYNVANYDITFSRLVRFGNIKRKEAMKRFLTKIPKSLLDEILREFNVIINKL